MRDCSYPGWDLSQGQAGLMQRFISSSHSGAMSGAGGQAGTSYRCSHCQDGAVVPSVRPLPSLIMEEIKNRVLGSPLPSRSDTDSVCLELMPLGGSQLDPDTAAALRRKKSKVRLRLGISQPTNRPLCSVDPGGGGQDKG